MLTYQNLVCYINGQAQKLKVAGIDSTFDAKEKYKDDLETWEIGNEHMCSIVLSTLL